MPPESDHPQVDPAHDPMRTASPVPVGVGRYRVQSRLSDGAMGQVLVGIDETGRRAALRLVAAEPAAEPGFRDRFRQELRAAALAPPWFCAAVLDADPEGDPPWLATAFVDGPTVGSFVSVNGPLGVQGTTALAMRLADGLVALHASGLVHRDITPSTVVLAEDGPRLLDMGVARATDPTSIARYGHPTGHPGFMAPELLAGRTDTGPAGDVFAFAAVVGYAATAHPPFPSATGPGLPGPAPDVPPAAATGPIRRPPVGEPELGPIPGRLRDVLAACLAPDPAARPTMAQVREQLAAVGSAAAPTVDVATRPAPAVPPGPAAPPVVGPPPGSVPPLVGPRTRRWVAVAAAAAIGAAVTVAAVFILGGGDGSDPRANGPTGAPTASPAPVPADIATVIDAAADDRFGADSARFATPSGNIACAMSDDEVRCDVAERSWDLPPEPDGCTEEYGAGAVVSGDRPGELSCAAGTVAERGLEVLEYGTAVRRDGVLCASRETGVRCENEVTRHGFQVARAAYELF
ncbi:serine/threonine-protein kinase [Pseudonocardia humida]|uniref:Serine/threonine protein kinase n=1 Tax=Pseudonocardia humida TaxID=2800819 RepID=A0ABT0ZZ48_9PSEU|nr:serine/threonine-protein kinase [Pseudonocardia humida]MCO1656019.1 serine/threonine protein kinase [Pseudonocardia humida]